MSKIAAFFDIDGTIYREGLITEVFKKIIKYELVDKENQESVYPILAPTGGASSLDRG